MSVNYLPSNLPGEPARDPGALALPQAWSSPVWGGGQDAEEAGIPWGRYFAALRRYKWMILAIVLAGTALGFGVSQFITPEYQVAGTIWISETDPRMVNNNRGPVRGEELLGGGAWADLLTSSNVMDRVVRRMGLYLWTTNSADSAAFAGFQPGTGFRAGAYALTVDPTGAKYSLSTKDGTVVERGAVGDSVGRTVGFLWLPTAAALGHGRTLEFSVQNPRQIANSLTKRVEVTLPQGSSFLKLTLTGASPRRTATILNTVMTEFVATATDLKRRNLDETAKTLQSQLDDAHNALQTSENKLQGFRTNTITLPTEDVALGNPGAAPVAPGADAAPNPVANGYFEQKLQLEALQRDEKALETLLANPATITADAFVPIQTAQQSPDLTAALQELSKRETALRAAREVYTEQHPTVIQLKASVQLMRTQTIPGILRALVEQLKKRETALGAQIGTATQQLKAIPSRSIELMRLQRDVQTKSALYQMLQGRFEEARLAAVSAIPDVSILDTAVAPLIPTKNTAPSIILIALLASLGGAVGLALLFDQTDSRFRYPEQASHDMRLTILGAVPTIAGGRGASPDPAEAAQVIEAFRTIRMNITNACGGAPMMFTISSPGPGDGKSLVSSNLALSFAEAGYRTVLVDGDTRRGQLHAMFNANRRPGLLDLLGGEAPLDAILRSTTHEKLTLVPCGTRRHRGPELLHSQAMLQLIADLRDRYDVIILDSPPFGAGVDPFVLGAATGNLVCVLRTGTTDRKLAEAKLQLMGRLPIRVLGAVLNDILAQGAYKYYSYLYGYTTSEDDDETLRLSPRVGELSGKA